MPLVTSEAMLLAAQKGGYAVGAFNVENIEMAQAVIDSFHCAVWQPGIISGECGGLS